MKILGLITLPFLVGVQASPFTTMINGDDNIEKSLILKGGSIDISGKVDASGFDINPWKAYYAGQTLDVTWKIIDCADERIKITPSGQVYWDAISSVQDITFKVAAETNIGHDHYYGQTRDTIVLRIKPKEWETIYEYQLPDAQKSMFQCEEYGAFESKYSFTSSQLIEDVDFGFNYFRFYVIFDSIHPRLGNGDISWSDGLGRLEITEELTFPESGSEYHFKDHVDGQKALTTNSVDLDIWLKRSNDNIMVTYTINGHYYSPNVFEPRTHWCSWDGGASIECLQYK